MSHPSFRFVIPATHQPARQTLALHLLVSFVLFSIGIFCGVMYWFTGISPNFKGAIGSFAVFGALCFLGGIGVYFFSVSAVRRARFAGLLRVLELSLLGGGAALFYYSDWEVPAVLFSILFALAVAAALYEVKAPADTVILVDEAGVQKQAGLRNQTFPWKTLRQVLYRRGILTIDCLDNRLYQYPVTAPQVDAQALEAFCAAQVEAALPHRSKSDW